MLLRDAWSRRRTAPTVIAALVEGALPQKRLLANAPLDVDRELLTSMYEHALSNW